MPYQPNKREDKPEEVFPPRCEDKDLIPFITYNLVKHTQRIWRAECLQYNAELMQTTGISIGSTIKVISQDEETVVIGTVVDVYYHTKQDESTKGKPLPLATVIIDGKQKELDPIALIKQILTGLSVVLNSNERNEANRATLKRAIKRIERL